MYATSDLSILVSTVLQAEHTKCLECESSEVVNLPVLWNLCQSVRQKAILHNLGNVQVGPDSCPYIDRTLATKIDDLSLVFSQPYRGVRR